MQIYENVSKEKNQILVGMTVRMLDDGKTPDEISIKVKQPIEKVKECINMIENARSSPVVVRKIEK